MNRTASPLDALHIAPEDEGRRQVESSPTLADEALAAREYGERVVDEQVRHALADPKIAAWIEQHGHQPREVVSIALANMKREQRENFYRVWRDHNLDPGNGEKRVAAFGALSDWTVHLAWAGTSPMEVYHEQAGTLLGFRDLHEQLGVSRDQAEHVYREGMRFVRAGWRSVAQMQGSVREPRASKPRVRNIVPTAPVAGVVAVPQTRARETPGAPRRRNKAAASTSSSSGGGGDPEPPPPPSDGREQDHHALRRYRVERHALGVQAGGR